MHSDPANNTGRPRARQSNREFDGGRRFLFGTRTLIGGYHLMDFSELLLLSVEVRVAGIDCSSVSRAPGHPWPACRSPRTDGDVVTKAFYFKLTNVQNDNILFILILEKVTTPSGRSSLCCA